MFRVIQKLLPRGLAWQTHAPTAKRLRQYLEGLGGFAGEVRAFIDGVFLDLFPETTRELAAWEKQFALNGGGSDAERRAKLAAAWAMQGGQSPDYIERTLHTAGFTTVFVHEWWDDSVPYEIVTRDPRPYVNQPLIGQYQCEPSTPWQCWQPEPGQPLAPHCDDTLVNDPGYLVNLDLTRRAPPPMPDDEMSWRYVFYIGGENFPDRALVPASRLDELKALILQIKPAQQWVVLLVDAFDEFEGFGASEFGSAPFGA